LSVFLNLVLHSFIHICVHCILLNCAFAFQEMNLTYECFNLLLLVSLWPYSILSNLKILCQTSFHGFPVMHPQHAWLWDLRVHLHLFHLPDNFFTKSFFCGMKIWCSIAVKNNV
jgi:hypothetical protein